MVSPTIGRSRARRNQLSWNGGSASPGSAGRAGRRRPARRPVAWKCCAFANTLDVEAGTDELSSPRALDERLAARDLTRSARGVRARVGASHLPLGAPERPPVPGRFSGVADFERERAGGRRKSPGHDDAALRRVLALSGAIKMT